MHTTEQQLFDMVRKICEYHNMIAEAEGPVDDELAAEIANYLSYEVPEILLTADPQDAFDCISATCKQLPHPYLVNILSGLVLYIFGGRLDGSVELKLNHKLNTTKSKFKHIDTSLADDQTIDTSFIKLQDR